MHGDIDQNGSVVHVCELAEPSIYHEFSGTTKSGGVSVTARTPFLQTHVSLQEAWSSLAWSPRLEPSKRLAYDVFLRVVL